LLPLTTGSYQVVQFSSFGGVQAVIHIALKVPVPTQTFAQVRQALLYAIVIVRVNGVSLVFDVMYS